MNKTLIAVVVLVVVAFGAVVWFSNASHDDAVVAPATTEAPAAPAEPAPAPAVEAPAATAPAEPAAPSTNP